MWWGREGGGGLVGGREGKEEGERGGSWGGPVGDLGAFLGGRAPGVGGDLGVAGGRDRCRGKRYGRVCGGDGANRGSMSRVRVGSRLETTNVCPPPAARCGAGGVRLQVAVGVLENGIHQTS